MAVKKQPIPFGKYFLLDRINIGGMAEVWRAKTFGESGFEKLVAIKRILPNIAEDEEFIKMFIDEAKITVQLTHANIAQVFDLGRIGDSYFIAMEYVAGRDLRAIFDRGRKRGEPAPIPLVCFAIGKMCEGLDYAHRKRDTSGRELHIVHRDVSPQNCLVSYEAEVKVIDFGIAKAANKATKTQAGILKGKFGYMSPEQVRGLPLDQRSDVFAAGIVLYEMLTGERLFTGDSDFSVLEKVRQVDILPPTRYNRRIPEGLEKVVLTALAKDPDERFPYASDLADALQRYVVTADAVFSRKDLMQYMKSTFAEDVDKEKARQAEYAEVRLPSGAAALAQAAPSPLLLTQRAPPTPLRPAGRAQPPDPGRAGAAGEITNPSAGEDPAAPAPEPRAAPVRERPERRAGAPEAPSGVMGGSDERTQVPSSQRAARASRPPPDAAASETLFSPPGRGGAAPAALQGLPRPAPAPYAAGRPPPMIGRPLPPNLGEPVRANGASLPRASPEPAPEPAGPPPSRWRWVMGGVGAGLLVLLLAALAASAFGDGSVQVAYEPVDARVYLDGREVCVRSPCIVSKVEARAHSLEIRKDRFESFLLMMEVPRREVYRVSPDVKLKSVVSAVSTAIASEPSDAAVSVDGKVVKALGISGMWTGELSIGEAHHVVVSKPGYESWNRTLSPTAADRTLNEFAPLRREAVRVRFSSAPAGAKVLIDDAEAGVTPFEAPSLDASRTHTVVFQKPCYEEETHTLLAGGPPGEVHKKLVKKRGCP